MKRYIGILFSKVSYYDDEHFTQVKGHAWQHLDYWLNLFPYLLLHIYHSCEEFKKEERFRKFYTSSKKFRLPDYFASMEVKLSKSQIGNFQTFPYINAQILKLFLILDDFYIDKNLIEINQSDVIGDQNENSVVCGGYFKDLRKEKPLAIKMQTSAKFRIVEISNLKKVQDCSHIIKFFGVCEIFTKNQNYYGIVLERAFCSLKQYFSDEINSSAREKLSTKKILLDITKGVCHLHKSRIAHRDLKPSNVLIIISENSRAVLADFGSSKDSEGKAAFTMSSSLSVSYVGF